MLPRTKDQNHTPAQVGPPFGLSARQICERGGFGPTYFWTKVAPELEAYKEGRHTKFTARSVAAREERLVAEGLARDRRRPRGRQATPPARRRGKSRKVAAPAEATAV